MNSNHKLVSTLRLPMRWVDLDAYGHVNNSKYFDYMSEARIVLFGDAFINSTIQFVVAETNCIYKKPYYHPSYIIINQHLKELGRTYMVFYYAFYLEGDTTHTLHAECTTKIVCFDPQTNKIVRIPNNFHDILK